ncbi:MAG: L-glyceraldehyde 3-phosphate reductase [Bacteroidales bacterium]|nr:L-glyceraldehyde 3-phosphate reductase [Bacteroidales bacterium]
MNYTASESRYSHMPYRRCGKSGLQLPSVSLGLWQNFSDFDLFDNCRNLLRVAFDHGITHFDLANNYGPPPGSAEETFGRVMQKDFRPYRDEMIIATKAGYDMWPGPYGDRGSKKYLVASLDQSLKRMGLDYVDIFYHHRPDPETPLEETMMALDLLVRQGKALYAGISNYSADQTREAIKVLKELKTPFVIHQAKYSMFERWVENGLLDVLGDTGAGCIAFSPLAQGMLTDKYLNGIPEGSRASRNHTSLNPDQVSAAIVDKARKLNEIASGRGQSLAQMAIAWLLKDTRVTSVLIGASKVSQLQNSLESLKNLSFSSEELQRIQEILE